MKKRRLKRPPFLFAVKHIPVNSQEIWNRFRVASAKSAFRCDTEITDKLFGGINPFPGAIGAIRVMHQSKH